MQNVQILLYWIREREKIREAHDRRLYKPWSEDRVFQTTYFCNVRREDDRTTKWIRTNWNEEHDKYEFAMCMARQINKVATLSNITPPWGAWRRDESYVSYVVSRLSVLQLRMSVWGDAYLVTTNGRSMPKLQYMAQVWDNIYESPLHEHLRRPGLTLEEAHAMLMKYEGFASFMSAQVIADLKNTEWHPLSKAEDWHTWAAPGPGSLRGLGWLLGRRVTPSEFKERISAAYQAVKDEGLELDLHMQDFQNCLCEFDKYMRVSTGSGKSKRRYRG